MLLPVGSGEGCVKIEAEKQELLPQKKQGEALSGESFNRASG
jgi:hypothetical protein